MIIDAHLHLDVNIDGAVESAAAELDKQLAAAGIARAIVLHLQMQPWTPDEVAHAIAKYPRMRGFINVHPYHENCMDELVNGITQLGFIGVKLHPRLQEFDINDPKTIRLVKKAGELNVPVLIDAFPDGTHLMQGFSPVKYAMLAKECPETNFIWAHMGGHYVLDFMMLAKRLHNVYMDMSYSLLYYENSAVTDNMIYAMRSMKFDRIFYGSDYPDRPIDTSLKNSIRILEGKGLNRDELDKLFSKNAIHFFKWNDL
jgi:predicted TIM-barrel fold metal-dependent hydrolase